MGTLRLTFIGGLADREQARILAALRKLKATPEIRPIQDKKALTWVFTTDPLPAPKQRARKPGSLPAYLKPPLSDRKWAAQYRARLLHAIETATLPCEQLSDDEHLERWRDAVASWNGDLWTWERVTRLEELAAGIAVARSCSTLSAPFPQQTKGVGMPNNPNWTDFDHDLRELHEISSDLIAGRAPEQYRVHGADLRILLPAYGRTQLLVGVWQEPYGALAAMCVAGFILFGTSFEERFARMGLTGDLIDAYEQLQRHYGPRVPRLDASTTSTTSLAKALEAPRADGFLKLTVKKPPPKLAAPRSSRPVLPETPSRPALPDLGGRS